MMAESLRMKIIAYYVANPDEECTIADLALKFDTTPARVSWALSDIRHTPRRAQGTMRLESVRVIRVKAGT